MALKDIFAFDAKDPYLNNANSAVGLSRLQSYLDQVAKYDENMATRDNRLDATNNQNAYLGQKFLNDKDRQIAERDYVNQIQQYQVGKDGSFLPTPQAIALANQANAFSNPWTQQEALRKSQLGAVDFQKINADLNPDVAIQNLVRSGLGAQPVAGMNQTQKSAALGGIVGRGEVQNKYAIDRMNQQAQLNKQAAEDNFNRQVELAKLKGASNGGGGGMSQDLALSLCKRDNGTIDMDCFKERMRYGLDDAPTSASQVPIPGDNKVKSTPRTDAFTGDSNNPLLTENQINQNKAIRAGQNISGITNALGGGWGGAFAYTPEVQNTVVSDLGKTSYMFGNDMGMPSAEVTPAMRERGRQIYNTLLGKGPSIRRDDFIGQYNPGLWERILRAMGGK